MINFAGPLDRRNAPRPTIPVHHTIRPLSSATSLNMFNSQQSLAIDYAARRDQFVSAISVPDIRKICERNSAES